MDAVAHLCNKNVVPKTIMQDCRLCLLMGRLTRGNVASHLQICRLYLKRMQGLSNGSGCDPATDNFFFVSSHVSGHFMRAYYDHYLPYVPVAAMQHQR